MVQYPRLLRESSLANRYSKGHATDLRYTNLVGSGYEGA